jgi:acetoin utilization deacetylase AcuC-like enzyme
MTPRPLFFEHPSSLQHDTGGHPENIARMVAIVEALDQRNYLGYELVSSPPVDRKVLELVHPAAYIDSIAAVSERGGGYLDADTIMSEGSYGAALHAAGGAVEMVRRLVEGGRGAIGFSAHRPPGHHAPGSRAMGFCLFNNIAVAARYALDVVGLERVLIVDWDVHHGNGTQDIFSDTDGVLFVSVHQYPLYPGTGAAGEIGRGPGEGYTVNLPVPPGSGDAEFVSMVRDVAVPLAFAYRPQLILVSAGYDAHRDDPLADCRVTDDGFAAMAAILRDLADDLDVPLGCVLEGGYDTAVLARGVVTTMEHLLASAPGFDAPDGPLAVGPRSRLATQALSRLTPIWPALAETQA